MIKDGKSVSHTAGSDISSGDVVELGNRIAIAMVDISTGKQGELALEGVFELPADNATAFSQGDDLYHDGTELTKTAAGNVYAGECHEAKAETATTARVKLSPPRPQAAAVADLNQDISATYVEAEVQAISDKVDDLLAKMRAAGLLANS